MRTERLFTLLVLAPISCNPVFAGGRTGPDNSLSPPAVSPSQSARPSRDEAADRRCMEKAAHDLIVERGAQYGYISGLVNVVIAR